MAIAWFIGCSHFAYKNIKWAYIVCIAHEKKLWWHLEAKQYVRQRGITRMQAEVLYFIITNFPRQISSFVSVTAKSAIKPYYQYLLEFKIQILTNVMTSDIDVYLISFKLIILPLYSFADVIARLNQLFFVYVYVFEMLKIDSTAQY